MSFFSSSGGACIGSMQHTALHIVQHNFKGPHVLYRFVLLVCPDRVSETAGACFRSAGLLYPPVEAHPLQVPVPAMSAHRHFCPSTRI